MGLIAIGVIFLVALLVMWGAYSILIRLQEAEEKRRLEQIAQIGIDTFLSSSGEARRRCGEDLLSLSSRGGMYRQAVILNISKLQAAFDPESRSADDFWLIYLLHRLLGPDTPRFMVLAEEAWKKLGECDDWSDELKLRWKSFVDEEQRLREAARAQFDAQIRAAELSEICHADPAHCIDPPDAD